MDVIKMALTRFKDLVDSLECECDSYHGFKCPLHDDRILAGKALAQIATQPVVEADAEKRCRCTGWRKSIEMCEICGKPIRTA